jgi:hypothetical protein
MAAPVGNQNAKKARLWSSALDRALARAAEGAGVEAGLDKIADKVVAGAINGDKDCWQEVAQRKDGKVPQGIIGGDENDPAISVNVIERVIVRAKASDTNG